MRLRDFASWLKQFDVTLETGTNHFIFRRDGGGMYPIPAHNGLKTELPDKYLKQCCKHFAIDPKLLREAE